MIRILVAILRLFRLSAAARREVHTATRPPGFTVRKMLAFIAAGSSKW